MTNYIIATILLLLAIAGVVVRKTYSYVPFKELKRRAEAGDPLAVDLYPTAAYRDSLKSLLWLFIVFTSACGIVLISREAPVWIAVVLVVLLIWLTYSWLPSSRLTRVGVSLTRFVNPMLLWVLGHLYPALGRSTAMVKKRYTAEKHSELFERDDLIELIEKLQVQSDSRFVDQELEIAKRALSFDDYTVSDILIPKKSVKSILADDTVGPVLIDEMHKSHQEHVMVRAFAKGDFVGTLTYKQLGLHSSGKVKDYMDANVNYIHEDERLGEALQTFFATKQSLFVVLNSAEEYVGVVTIEKILGQLLDYNPSEEFESFDNPAAVVERFKRKQEKEKEAYVFEDESEDHNAEESISEPAITEDTDQPTAKKPTETAPEISDESIEETSDESKEIDEIAAEQRPHQKNEESIFEDADKKTEHSAPKKIERVIDEEIDMSELDDEASDSKAPKSSKH